MLLLVTTNQRFFAMRPLGIGPTASLDRTVLEWDTCR
jgi:hypothetical protein